MTQMNTIMLSMFHKQAQARIDIKDFRPDKQMQ